VWEACLAVKDDHAEITPLLHDPHDSSDLTPKATEQKKMRFSFVLFFYCVCGMLCLTLINWYVFIICWGLNLKLYSKRREGKKETSCGWLKNKSDRMTCRERWWWSNSWLGAFFFLNFIFCLSCGISRPPWTIFFSFYYRRNSWVVSTFFWFALDRRSFLFLRPFAPWVGDHPCPGAVVPWTSTTTAAIGQKI
jgi:hypothetical protein